MSTEVISCTAIVMATGAANICRDGSKTRCAILLGNMGLFRVYPIPAHYKFKVWSEVEVTLNRPRTDNRSESWNLVDWKVTGTLEDPALRRAIYDRCTLDSGTLDPLTYQNKNFKSICIVKPIQMGSGIEPREARIPDENESRWHTQADSPIKPYIKWTSIQGSVHNSHISANEAYETHRKNPTEPYQLFHNMKIHSPDWDFWLVMGNLKDKRNVWCIVHVGRLKKTSGTSTPLFIDLTLGKPAAWPYELQGGGNQPVKDNQLMMSEMLCV